MSGLEILFGIVALIGWAIVILFIISICALIIVY